MKNPLSQILTGVAIGAALMTLTWNIIDVTGLAGAVSNRVAEYCLKKPEERKAIREKINARIYPNSVELTCAGDQ